MAKGSELTPPNASSRPSRCQPPRLPSRGHLLSPGRTGGARGRKPRLLRLTNTDHRLCFLDPRCRPLPTTTRHRPASTRNHHRRRRHRRHHQQLLHQPRRQSRRLCRWDSEPYQPVLFLECQPGTHLGCSVALEVSGASTVAATLRQPAQAAAASIRQLPHTHPPLACRLPPHHRRRQPSPPSCRPLRPPSSLSPLSCPPAPC